GGGAVLSAGGLVAAGLSHSVPVAVVAFFAGGAGVSVVAPILFSAAGRAGPEAERAGAVATMTTVGYAGFLIGPPLVGGIAQAVGLRASFAVLAGVALLLGAATPRLALGQARAAARSG
ncbi:MAG TPA: MFS transporter, partial [Gaiellaceae bacterium]|nr:MFS transporter [Gaiellaceae bacterium]